MKSLEFLINPDQESDFINPYRILRLPMDAVDIPFLPSRKIGSHRISCRLVYIPGIDLTDFQTYENPGQLKDWLPDNYDHTYLDSVYVDFELTSGKTSVKHRFRLIDFLNVTSLVECAKNGTINQFINTQRKTFRKHFREYYALFIPEYTIDPITGNEYPYTYNIDSAQQQKASNLEHRMDELDLKNALALDSYNARYVFYRRLYVDPIPRENIRGYPCSSCIISYNPSLKDNEPWVIQVCESFIPYDDSIAQLYDMIMLNEDTCGICLSLADDSCVDDSLTTVYPDAIPIPFEQLGVPLKLAGGNSPALHLTTSLFYDIVQKIDEALLAWLKDFS